MLEVHEIPRLVIKDLEGKATPAEIQGLEEWASLSINNRNLLQHLYDKDWVTPRVEKCLANDLEANRTAMWRMIVTRQKEKDRTKAFYYKAGKYAIAATFIGMIVYLSIDYFSNTHVHSVTINKDRQSSSQLPADENNVSVNQPFLPNKINARYVSTVEHEIKFPQEQTVMVPPCGKLTDTLPDNSRIWMNSASSIKYPKTFDDLKRTVRITGEVYFDVKYDYLQPFLVTVNGVSVATSGGRFNINAYPEEGKARVTALTENIRVAVGPIDTTIQRGQSAVIEQNKGIVIIQEDVYKILDWKLGYFLFKNDPESAVINELARWYGLTVEYKSKKKTTRLISCIASRDSKAVEVVNNINHNNGTQLEIRGSRLIIK